MKISISKWVLALIFIGLLVFGNSLFNGFVWDDEEQVLNNNLVHSLTSIPALFGGSTFNTGGGGGLAGMYYKPMMSVSFATLYTFFGPNPFFFHLFQVSLHIINSILLLSLFSTFFKIPLAFFLALIFLIHPINVETAVYSSALQDVLFMFFGLLALHKIRGLKWSSSAQITTGVLLLLALLSKETGLLFLPIITFYCWLFLKERFRFSLIASGLSLSIYLFLRLIVAQVLFGHQGPSPILNADLLQRLLTLPKIIFFYLQTFFYPKDLAIAQHWLVKTPDWNNFYLPLLLSVLFFTTLLAWLAWTLLKKGKSLPIIFFCGWFLLGLALHLQIFPLDMTVAERWFYLPEIGLIGLIGLVINSVLLRFPRQRKIFLILGLIVVLTLSVRTMIRNTDWKDGLTLYSKDSQISRDAFDLENNFGVELFRHGNFDQAAIHFVRSTELAPNWWTNWSNLGVIAQRKNNLTQAKTYYQKAIDNGNYYLAYENLAGILFTENPQKAKEFIKQSLIKLPLNSKLWFFLSLSEYKIGNRAEALVAAQRAYLLSPDQQTYYLYATLQSGQPLDLP